MFIPPATMKSRRLRFVLDTKSGATPSSAVKEYWDGDINWVTPEDLGKLKGRYVLGTRRQITDDGYNNCGVSLAYQVQLWLIDIINERFGAELSEADQLFFDQIAEAAIRSEILRKAAEVNSLDKFQLVFQQVLETLFIERMELNEELFTDYMSKPEMQELVAKWLGSQVYDRLGGLRGGI